MGCIYGPHRSEIIIETVLGRLPSPGYYTDNRLNYTSSIPKKKKSLFTCSVTSTSGAGFRFTTILEAAKVLSGNIGWGLLSMQSPLAFL